MINLLTLYKYDELYQWDSGRQLLITPDADGNIPTVVEFECDGGGAIEVSPVTNDDGEITAAVPNICLQKYGTLICYEVINLSNGHITYHRFSFTIKRKSKPSNYAYKEDDVLTWRELDGRIKVLEDSIGFVYYTAEKPENITPRDMWVKII